MGFFRDDAPGHEGYPIAFVLRDGCSAGSELFRELQYPRDNTDRSDIERIAAGCDCGWRSPMFRPSALTPPQWGPYSVLASERDEDRIRDLWRRHICQDVLK